MIYSPSEDAPKSFETGSQEKAPQKEECRRIRRKGGHTSTSTEAGETKESESQYGFSPPYCAGITGASWSGTQGGPLASSRLFKQGTNKTTRSSEQPGTR